MWHPSTMYQVISHYHHWGPAASLHCTEAGSYPKTLFWADWCSWSGTAEQNVAGQRLDPLRVHKHSPALTFLSHTHTYSVGTKTDLVFPRLIIRLSIRTTWGYRRGFARGSSVKQEEMFVKNNLVEITAPLVYRLSDSYPNALSHSGVTPAEQENGVENKTLDQTSEALFSWLSVTV